MNRTLRNLALGVILATGAAPVQAQQPGTPPPPPPPAVVPLAVGVMAPDFELPMATMAGVSANRLRLTELRGKTVVIAFFFRARSSG